MLNLITSAALFCSIIFIVLASGLGLVKLLGMGKFNQRIFLAPVMILTVSSIFVCIAALFGVPIKIASPFVWIFWIALTCIGIKDLLPAYIAINEKQIFWVAILATLIVLIGYFLYGLFNFLGSPALDGWSYVAFGDYLYHYKRGSQGGLMPIYQYASHLSGTRFAAPAMLAVLIPPTLELVDTQMTVSILLIWCIFSYAMSVAYVALSMGVIGKKFGVGLILCFSTFGGWVPQALHMNNYDNLIALPLAPILFALGLNRQYPLINQVLLPGILIAGSVYIYPELSPLIIAGYFLGLIIPLIQALKVGGDWKSIKLELLKLTAVLVLAALILGPYLQEVWGFFMQQWAIAGKLSGRAGEGFMPALLNPALFISAIWGWGNLSGGLVIGCGLFVLFFIGVHGLFVKKSLTIIIYIILISALLVIMIAVNRYDYGAYKIILFGWWAISISIVFGAQILWAAVKSIKGQFGNFLKVLIIIFFITAFSAWLISQYQLRQSYIYKKAIPLHEIKEYIKGLNSPILVSIDNPQLNSWMVYQLRSSDVRFLNFQGYMAQAHVAPLMLQSKQSDIKNISYLLTEVSKAPKGNLIWSNELFKLEKIIPGYLPPQMAINAENGAEVVAGLPFVWIGQKPITISLKSQANQSVDLNISLTVGPSVDASIDHYPKLIAKFSGKVFEYSAASTKEIIFKLPLVSGENILSLEGEYVGRIKPNSNGDLRTLLIGIKINGMTLSE